MTKTSDLYSTRKDCCGCEACVASCPPRIIDMKADYDGFLYPEINEHGKCIDCKKCLKVCPLKKEISLNPAKEHYGGYSKSDEDIKKSASGAIAYDISRQFIKDDGIVYGVAYTNQCKDIKYIRCQNLDVLEKLRGSKYAQARKDTVYYEIRKDLKERKVLFIGLPCDVHAVKILFGDNDNLFTIALICHGPTSPAVHQGYINSLKKTSSIIDFSVRYKNGGWKPYFIKAEFEDGSSFLEEFHPSIYGIAFKQLKRPSCSECHFKLNFNKSSIDADIIIGDYHGAIPGSKWYNPWGASQISILTDKGRYLKNSIKDTFILHALTPRQAISYNKALPNIIKPRWNREAYARKFASEGLEKASKLWSIKFIDFYTSCKVNCMRSLAKLKKLLIN